MKTKNNRAVPVLPPIVCLLPLILSFAVYGELPEQIAIHWDIAGNPNNYIPKFLAAFGLPVLLMAINIFSILLLYNDPKRDNASTAMRTISVWLVPLISLVAMPITLFIAMGVNISASIVMLVLTGIVIIVCGNYLPKSRQNYVIGIRLPWTLNNADNWNKTHRVAGRLWIFGGVAIIIGAFVSFDNSIWAVLSVVILIPIAVVPFFYSYMLYRKERNRENAW
jgi:uncharacterized membrane protein